MLGVAGTKAPPVMVLGGNQGALAIARGLQAVGVPVRLWTTDPSEEASAREAGLDIQIAKLTTDLDTREAHLDEVETALLLTDSDNLNALVAYELRATLGTDSVFRLSPKPGVLDVGPAYEEGEILFSRDLTYPELSRRVDAGARVKEMQDPYAVEANGATPLFALRGDGRLRVINAGASPAVNADERLICLS